MSHVQTTFDSAYHTYHQDEQGSTAYITGHDNVVENYYQYDVFGNLTEKKESIENRILYTGQQYDQETGRYYLRARYYNPVVGRFLQEDTYRGDGLNLYAYCANNPVMYYDPSGHGTVPAPTCGTGSNNAPGNTQGNQVGSNPKRQTPDQQAVIELAKEAKKKGSITESDASILLGWANEYGVPNHGPETHANRPGAASNVPHIHIGKTGHIPIVGK